MQSRNNIKIGLFIVADSCPKCVPLIKNIDKIKKKIRSHYPDIILAKIVHVREKGSYVFPKNMELPHSFITEYMGRVPRFIYMDLDLFNKIKSNKNYKPNPNDKIYVIGHKMKENGLPLLNEIDTKWSIYNENDYIDWIKIIESKSSNINSNQKIIFNNESNNLSSISNNNVLNINRSSMNNNLIPIM